MGWGFAALPILTVLQTRAGYKSVKDRHDRHMGVIEDSGTRRKDGSSDMV